MLDRGFEKARVVGLVDNDRTMIRREARGFVVLGTYEDLDVVHQRFHIDQIWYGSSTSEEDQALVRDWCLTNHAEAVALTALPGFRKLAKSSSPAEGKVAVTKAKSESKAEVAV
jgi:FlaA1/EpsC-like NDP-sugar epimerase